MSTWEEVSKERDMYKQRVTKISRSYMDLWKAIDTVVAPSVATKILEKEIELHNER